MAIDPRISMGLNPLNIAQPLQIFNQVREQQRQRAFDPLKMQQMQQGITQNEQALQAGQLDLSNAKDASDLKSVAEFSALNRGLFDSQDLPGVTNAIVQRKAQLQSQGRDTTQTDEMIQILNERGLDGLNQKLLASEQLAQNTGLINTHIIEKERQVPVDIQTRDRLLSDAKSDDPIKSESAKVELGLIPAARVKKDPKLSSFAEKTLNESQTKAIESGNNASRFDVLAGDFEKADVGGGIFSGKWGESLKDITGTQDAVTELRKRYMGIRASQVVKNLPPGSASDVDIALALSGFPSENANGKQVSSFMRGLAKLERFDEKFNRFKAQYISDNKNTSGMLRAWDEEVKSEQPAQEITTDPSSQVDSTQNEVQSFQDGMTATNPQTGERLIFRNGNWEPVNG